MSQTPVFEPEVARATGAEEALPEPGSATSPVPARLTPLGVLGLSSWCGLVAGLLEVWAFLLYKRYFAVSPIWKRSHHFIWMVPLGELAMFTLIGVFLALAMCAWRRGAVRVAPALLAFLTVLAGMLVFSESLAKVAYLLVAAGSAKVIIQFLAPRAAAFRRGVVYSLPVLIGIVGYLMVIELARSGMLPRVGWAAARPLPPAQSPNVLLIVLDTVRADHLSAYGYGRPTTPNLERLARRGVKFERARATAPWTLPSHSSMFTGRWPSEHKALNGWMPLDATFPTIAEVMRDRGYATAGFAENLSFCSRQYGIDRGFDHYEDHPFDPMNLINYPTLVRRFWSYGTRLLHRASPGLSVGIPRGGKAISPAKHTTANLHFLDWLSSRARDARPFFAFLNYITAHGPYEIPYGFERRFGSQAAAGADIAATAATTAGGRIPPEVAQNIDKYDTCIAYLDEQLDQLFDELDRRKILDDTVVIVTADHGESFGEHGMFSHCNGLYRPEIRVPLLIFGPKRLGLPEGVSIAEPVTLRDLPPTILDLSGGDPGSATFPGSSLARCWNRGASAGGEPQACLSELNALSQSRRERITTLYGVPVPAVMMETSDWLPTSSLAEGDFSYIRWWGNSREELYNIVEDPDETRNLVDDPAMRPTLSRFRERLKQAGETPPMFP